MKISILLLTLLTPILCFSQVYKFNRQVIITYTSDKTRNADTWFTPIEVEVSTRYVIMRRPSNGSGEPATADTIEIKGTQKSDHYFKITTKDERTIVIYSDEYMTMTLKPINGKRTEYCFYNQEKE